MNLWNSLLFAMLGGVIVVPGFCNVAPNSRANNTDVISSPRNVNISNNSDVVSRSATTNSVRNNNSSIINRDVPASVSNVNTSRSAITTPATSRAGTANVSRAAATPNVSRTATNVSRSATNVSRSATTPNVSRSATSVVDSPSISRSQSVSRANTNYTSISDVGEYSGCANSYNDCMDQFCATANDSYRRCFCSSKITEFKKLESALDQVSDLLVQYETRYENSNFMIVDRDNIALTDTYSQNIGESLINYDVEAAQDTLVMISELMSGQKPAAATSTSGTLGIAEIELSGFASDIGAVFTGGKSSGSLLSQTDITELEGTDLYIQAHNQCLELSRGDCASDTVTTMATSAYNILITKDCDVYEDSLDAKQDAVETAVRDASKILSNARLAESAADNSIDTNECLKRVQNAMQSDDACGVNYVKCLDPSGRYINPNTGAAIYSPNLFDLTSTINLYVDYDYILGENPEYSQWLEDKKTAAEVALATCLDISDLVWAEFKKSAVFEIEQQQTNLIQNIKNTCVDTVSECYNTDTNTLKIIDQSESFAICQEKIAACAALYADVNGAICNFDAQGRLTNAAECGLEKLTKFTETETDMKIAENCVSAITYYAEQLCATAEADSHAYPWGCRFKAAGDLDEDPSAAPTASMIANIKQMAMDSCLTSNQINQSYENLPATVQQQVAILINNIQSEMDIYFAKECDKHNGLWTADNYGTLVDSFYDDVFGEVINSEKYNSWGRCVQNTTFVKCEEKNTTLRKVASFDGVSNTCTFTEEWFIDRCRMLNNSYYDDGVCYVK